MPIPPIHSDLRYRYSDGPKVRILEEIDDQKVKVLLASRTKMEIKIIHRSSIRSV